MQLYVLGSGSQVCCWQSGWWGVRWAFLGAGADSETVWLAEAFPCEGSRLSACFADPAQHQTSTTRGQACLLTAGNKQHCVFVRVPHMPPTNPSLSCACTCGHTPTCRTCLWTGHFRKQWVSRPTAGGCVVSNTTTAIALVAACVRRTALLLIAHQHLVQLCSNHF